MEAIYSKLYNKYTTLKSKKDSEIEQINCDQEEKFKSYMTVADDLIGYLTSEKDKLNEQVSDLRQEVASIRSAKDEEQGKYEKMLIEENQKNQELSEEIERLRRKESHSSTSDDLFAGSPLPSGGTNNTSMRKRRRNEEKEVEVALGVGDQHEHSLPDQSVNALDKENMFSDAFRNTNQPKCCRRRLGPSANASDPSICMFQELLECLVDLKFSIANKADDNTLITAVHESSGYSFSLGWVKNPTGEEELMYRMSLLGTFERIAPEWMRDVMIFSRSMCRIFFKKVSTIV